MTTRTSNLAQFPELSRFYGLSFFELANMPRVFVDAYIDAMPRLQAAEQIQAITAATYPHMKQQYQHSIIRRLERETGRGIPPASVGGTPEQMKEKLAPMGIAVEVRDRARTR